MAGLNNGVSGALVVFWVVYAVAGVLVVFWVVYAVAGFRKKGELEIGLVFYGREGGRSTALKVGTHSFTSPGTSEGAVGTICP